MYSRNKKNHLIAINSFLTVLKVSFEHCVQFNISITEQVTTGELKIISALQSSFVVWTTIRLKSFLFLNAKQYEAANRNLLFFNQKMVIYWGDIKYQFIMSLYTETITKIYLLSWNFHYYLTTWNLNFEHWQHEVAMPNCLIYIST